MRAIGWAAAAALAASVTACGGGDDDADASPAGGEIEVVISEDTSPIARLRDVTCERGESDQLLASGIVSSVGDAPHYINLQIRFVDGDGVRVELASDSVSDLLVGESARWDATTYADGAAEVERCEVTATVS